MEGSTMSTTTAQAPAAGAAATDAPLTDGFHLLVDALKINGVQTMYGVSRARRAQGTQRRVDAQAAGG